MLISSKCSLDKAGATCYTVTRLSLLLGAVMRNQIEKENYRTCERLEL